MTPPSILLSHGFVMATLQVQGSISPKPDLVKFHKVDFQVPWFILFPLMLILASDDLWINRNRLKFTFPIVSNCCLILSLDVSEEAMFPFLYSGKFKCLKFP